MKVLEVCRPETQVVDAYSSTGYSSFKSTGTMTAKWHALLKALFSILLLLLSNFGLAYHPKRYKKEHCNLMHLWQVQSEFTSRYGVLLLIWPRKLSVWLSQHLLKKFWSECPSWFSYIFNTLNPDPKPWTQSGPEVPESEPQLLPGLPNHVPVCLHTTPYPGIEFASVRPPSHWKLLSAGGVCARQWETAFSM